MKNFRKYQKGFTLLELMIVVAIAGIIASIALPSYQEQVRKSKRSEAKVALLRVSQLQESFFVQNLSYAKDLQQLNFATVKMPSEKGLYEMQITSVTPAGCDVAAAPPVSCLTYELTATPVNGKGQELDHDCIGFRVDNVSRKWAKASLKGTGAKSFATTTASSPYQTAKAAECWNK